MRLFWSFVAVVCGVATYLNTDALIPVLRGWIDGSVLVTVIVVSVIANIKVVMTVVSVHRSGAAHKINRVGWVQGLMARMQLMIEKVEVPAIVFLTILPLPLTRTACTVWCSTTQSNRGLVALLAANPIHVLTYVLIVDWFLGR